MSSAPSPPHQGFSVGEKTTDNAEVLLSLRAQVGSLTTLCADLELEVMLLRRALYQNSPSQIITSAAVDPLYIRAHQFDTHELHPSSNQKRIGPSLLSLNANAMRSHQHEHLHHKATSNSTGAGGNKADGAVTIDALQTRIKSLEALNMTLFIRTMDDTSELRYHRFGELQRGSDKTNHHTSSKNSPLSSLSTAGRTAVTTTPQEVKQRFMEGKSAFIERRLEVLQSTLLDGSRRDVGQHPIERMAISRTRTGNNDDDTTSSSVDTFQLRKKNEKLALTGAGGSVGGLMVGNASGNKELTTHPTNKTSFFEEVAHRNATGSSLGLPRGLIGENEPAPRTRLRDGTTATSVPYALRGYVGR